MTDKKTFAQLTRETIDFEKGVTTIDVPDDINAQAYALLSNVLFLKVYTAEKPDDALAAELPRVYTAGKGTVLRETWQLVHLLEAGKNDDALGESLPRLFSRVTQDEELQQKFNAASRKTGTAAKIDAVVNLLKTELPEEVFLTPLRGGFIRMEKNDVCIDGNHAVRFPRPWVRNP